MEDIQSATMLRYFLHKIDHYHSKNGFTLIEVLIALSIIMISFSFSIGIIKSYKKIFCSTDVQKCSSLIVSFIMEAKHYCRNNNAPGTIIFDTANNVMIYSVNTNVVRKYKLPDGFKLSEINSKDRMITINSNGLTGSACSVKYIDREGNEHKITMRVGTFYVEIKY